MENVRSKRNIKLATSWKQASKFTNNPMILYMPGVGLMVNLVGRLSRRALGLLEHLVNLHVSEWGKMENCIYWHQNPPNFPHFTFPDVPVQIGLSISILYLFKWRAQKLSENTSALWKLGLLINLDACFQDVASLMFCLFLTFSKVFPNTALFINI